MKLKKYAFSMSELLVIMVCVGIVMVVAMNVLNSRLNQYGASYYVAYNALKKAAYNVLADMYCPDQNSLDAACKKGPRPFPASKETGTRDLCNRLIEFINVPSDDNYCNEARPINDKATNFNDKTLQFVSTNSFKFYISKYHSNIKDLTDDIGYFIVYVDINGDKKPNRVNMVDNSDILPDIVPFAVTTRGDVIPMGFPIYRKEYLTSRIKLPATADDNRVINDDRYSSARDFFSATRCAWSNVERVDIPFSINFTRRMNASSKALEFNTTPPTSCVDSDGRDFGCIAGTYTCRVTVDRSEFNRY